MQDYPAYILLNSYDLDALSNYEPIPTVAVRPWPTQQPMAELAKARVNSHDLYDEMPRSVIDSFVTISLMMFVLLSSSVLLGFTADRLTQGLVMLMEHRSQPEIVAR